MTRYSVDFDGILNLEEQDFPYASHPNLKLIEWLKEQQSKGDKLILNTLREGEILKIAIAFCNYHKLYFNAINNNLAEDCIKWGYNSRKISADVYIDDKNVDWQKLIKGS